MKESYPVQTLCRVLGCARSSFYYTSAEKEEGALLAAMEQIMVRWPFYGYRRLLAQLRREGWAVGERIVRRLLKFLGGSRQMARLTVKTTDSSQPPQSVHDGKEKL